MRADFVQLATSSRPQEPVALYSPARFSAAAQAVISDPIATPGAAFPIFRGLEVVQPVQTVPDAGAAAADVPQQVIRAIRMQWRAGGGEARLRLQPDHLGEVTLTVRVDGTHVTAVVQAETAAAQASIAAHQAELRAALSDHGLQLDPLVVEVDPDGQRQNASEHEQRQIRRRASRARSNAGPVFDIDV